jgi:uncharacterized surface protein with fasciclin (FAS1) repeats
MLTSILKFHVVAAALPADKVVGSKQLETLSGQRLPVQVRGDAVRIGDADVVKTDIRCSNGVIHVIDAVLMPPTQDLVETAVAAGQFRTLAAALQAAGLAEALKGEGPFTVFAPTDEAFAKLPAGTVESLLKPENKDKLAGILKLHVVPGRAWSSDLESGAVKTLNGRTVDVKVGDQVMVNGAKVVRADIAAKNGVIHVIDAVQLPKD